MKRPLSLLCLLAACCGAASCALTSADQKETIADLTQRVEALQTTLDHTEQELADVAAVTADQQTAVEGLATREDMEQVLEHLQKLPAVVASACPQSAPPSPQCEDVRPVVMSGDTMLLGELEYVWIEPPGVSLHARIDTGASRSSVSAEDVVQFERDGDKWVRFGLRPADGGEDDVIEIERRVVRFVRVLQQADPDGTRRPVVRLRVRLGDIHDSFEFTLADRSHLDQAIILGRNFLTDVAIVDVAKQYVQPKYRPTDGT